MWLLLVADVGLAVIVVLTGGTEIIVGTRSVSIQHLRHLQTALWLILAAGALVRWRISARASPLLSSTLSASASSSRRAISAESTRSHSKDASSSTSASSSPLDSTRPFSRS